MEENLVAIPTETCMVGWKYYSRKAIKAIEMKQRPFLIR
jgi:tRNA A37 threonylcarbamoyladenosine synthetase subunit TsaC/SUA5/YrdC